MTVRKNILILFIISLCLTLYGCLYTAENRDNSTESVSLVEATGQENCNWCGTSEAPNTISWKTTIPSTEEPGEKLIISGTIYRSDGKTPAKDVIVYVYHTNIKGIYPKKGNEKGNGKYHGYLRGWMKTNSMGHYEFETIRPAPYHTHGGEPAHIHYTIQDHDYPEYWLTATWFSDDPRVTDDYKKSVKRNGGFSNIITLTKDDHNVLRGERNIILERYE